MSGKGRIPFSMVGEAHSYTRSPTPWIMADGDPASGRLIKYISGGGMRAFGRTVRQEEIRRRHLNFWIVFGGLFAAWLTLLVF